MLATDAYPTQGKVSHEMQTKRINRQDAKFGKLMQRVGWVAIDESGKKRLLFRDYFVVLESYGCT